MLFEQDEGWAGQEPPEVLAGSVTPTDAGLEITGDDVAANPLYLALHDGAAVIANRLDGLLDHISATGTGLSISPFGNSGLLHRGFVPLPHTEFEGVYLLTMGDTARLTWGPDGARMELDAGYPWFAANSTSDGVPDEATLLSLLTKSTARALATSADGLLMLSSGKDSVAIALAAAEAGFKDVLCVTYSSGADDPEPPVAADVCNRLGLQHRIVEMTSDSAWIEKALIRFFTSSAAAGADLAQIPLVIAAAASGVESGVSMAGDGNDSYMGSLVKPTRALKARLRVRGRELAVRVRRFIPVDSPLNYVARSKLEAGLPGRMMRHHESSRLYPAAVDTSEFWWYLSRMTSHMGSFDAYSIFDKHFTVPSSQKKHVLASRAVNLEPAFPWCDHEIADYYFNLPVEHRYDESSGISKILLRRMLKRFLEFDVESNGSRYFAFDGARFVVDNEGFIRTEINQCEMWDRRGVAMVNNWIDRIESRPFLYHPILTVFMVSGWHNHSRFLPSSAVATEKR